jgi:hypothetical protein
MRHIRRPTHATVIAYLALFVALGGTAMAAVVVSSNSQVASNTISGHKPPSGKHSNLIAGSVNGQDVADNSLGGTDVNESSLTGNAQKLSYTKAASSAPAPKSTIATVGPYAIKGQCLIDDSANVFVRMYVNGPAGTQNSMWSETRNNNTDNGTRSNGAVLNANTDAITFDIEATPTSFERAGGTTMLRTNAGVLVQVDFHAVADARLGGQQNCFIYGTATRLT